MRAMTKKTIKVQKKETLDEITKSIAKRSARNISLWREKWSFGISLAVTPKIIFLVIIWGLFSWLTLSAKEETRTILEIIVMIFSSILTAVFVQDWMDARGNTELENKSTTSIRYLQSLKYKIKNVADRIREIGKDGMKGYDEILNLIGNIDKDILNSISDWADINPASTAIVDYFEDLRINEELIKQLKIDKLELEEQKEKLKNAKTDVIGRLEGEISKKESKISELQRRISEQSISNFSIASGTYPVGYGYAGVSTVSGGAGNRCKRCGGMMSALDGYDPNPSNVGLCSVCKSNTVTFN